MNAARFYLERAQQYTRSFALSRRLCECLWYKQGSKVAIDRHIRRMRRKSVAWLNLSIQAAKCTPDSQGIIRHIIMHYGD